MGQDGDIYTSCFLCSFYFFFILFYIQFIRRPQFNSTSIHHHQHKPIHLIHPPSSLPLLPTLPPNHPTNPSTSHSQCQRHSPPPVQNANTFPEDAYAVTAAESSRVTCVSISARGRGVRRVGGIRVIRSLRTGICSVDWLRCVLLGLGLGDLGLIDP